MSECRCSFAKRLTGDGCEICNPAKALEYAKEEIKRLRKVEAQAEQVVICDSWGSEECYDELWKLKEMLEAE